MVGDPNPKANEYGEAANLSKRTRESQSTHQALGTRSLQPVGGGSWATLLGGQPHDTLAPNTDGGAEAWEARLSMG